MSTINRSYCVVIVEKETNVFLDIVAIKPTIDEAIAFRNSHPIHPDHLCLIWAVVNK